MGECRVCLRLLGRKGEGYEGSGYTLELQNINVDKHEVVEDQEIHTHACTHFIILQCFPWNSTDACTYSVCGSVFMPTDVHIVHCDPVHVKYFCASNVRIDTTSL